MKRLECPYRRLVAERDDGVAVCDLLRELSKVEDASFCEVQKDACAACCESFSPSHRRFNPVVASLLFNLSSVVLERGGVAGCSVEDAAGLNHLASENIPAEADCVSIANESRRQANADKDLPAIVPYPRRRTGPAVARWATGVTTAPRDQSTLEACVRSMAAAGWDSPRMFIDGDVTPPAFCAHLPTTRRDPQIGAWPNYLLALAELLMREPNADAYMLVQDDAVFFQHEGLRHYLESCLWPGDQPGLISLYCSRVHRQETVGWHRLDEPLLWGALAVVYSHTAATEFLADIDVVRHRFSQRHGGLAKIDACIGEWAYKAGVPIHLPTPSLVQHIGHVSAIWPSAQAVGNRRADCFAGDPQCS